MSSMSPLFKRYIDGFTIGELPKSEHAHIEVSPERWRELGYVQLQDGSWAHHSECALLPKNGKFTWVRMG